MPLAPDQVHPMQVEAGDLTAAAAHYAQTLRGLAGDPPVLDLIHLGMGPDGHTASAHPPGTRSLTSLTGDVASGVSGEASPDPDLPAINRARRPY